MARGKEQGGKVRAVQPYYLITVRVPHGGRRKNSPKLFSDLLMLTVVQVYTNTHTRTHVRTHTHMK